MVRQKCSGIRRSYLEYSLSSPYETPFKAHSQLCFYCVTNLYIRLMIHWHSECVKN